MVEIIKYEFDECNHRICWCSMKKSPYGKYIEYEDHLAIINKLKEELKELQQRITDDNIASLTDADFDGSSPWRT